MCIRDLNEVVENNLSLYADDLKILAIGYTVIKKKNYRKVMLWTISFQMREWKMKVNCCILVLQNVSFL